MRAWAVVLVLAGCGGGGDSEADVRAAVEGMRDASLAGDYGRLWEYLSADSRDAVGEHLEAVRRLDPREDPSAEFRLRAIERTYGISRERLFGMDARAYFVALLEGLDPKARDAWLDRARGLSIAKITVTGSRATVAGIDAAGGVRETAWVNEDGAWRCAVSPLP